MNSQQKKIATLVVLAIIWGGLVAWQLYSREEPVRVPLTNVKGPMVGSAKGLGPSNDLHVRLDLLSAARSRQEMVFTTPRNIFGSPAPAGSIQSSSELDSDMAKRQQAIAAELSQFHYLGYVRVGEVWQNKPRLAVLTKQDDLHVVKRGEKLDNHVLVKAITRESVTLQDQETRVEYTVLLSEEPLAQ